jgi:uncharacterized membrane protein
LQQTQQPAIKPQHRNSESKFILISVVFVEQNFSLSHWIGAKLVSFSRMFVGQFFSMWHWVGAKLVSSGAGGKQKCCVVLAQWAVLGWNSSQCWAVTADNMRSNSV